MKKTIKILCIALSVLFLMSQTAFASEMMVMHGKTNSDSSQVVVLVLDSSVSDRTSITKNDIKYIDQSDVDENGRFSITLPFFDSEEYTLHSNLDFATRGEDEKPVLYVSSNGDDNNNGYSSETPFKTLAAAYAEIGVADEIVLLDSVAYTEAPAHNETLTIRGASSDVVLTFPSEVSLNGALTIDNVVLSGTAKVFANGHKLKITETVTSVAQAGSSANRLTVYGGKKDADLTGDTYLELLGGKYGYIYGGGGRFTSGKTAKVTGNTNVILGGTANAGDGICDCDTHKSTLSPSYVFGGGYDAAVTGETNITIKDNAIALYLIGAGFGTYGSTPKTNINVNGGKVMNVYGGATNHTLTNCDTHITMTAGLVEAVFGGSASLPMTGNTYITLLGGDVSRRVYSGCYNEYDLKSIFSEPWKTGVYVTGTTNLVVSSDVKIASKTELCSDNASDMGLFAGSRYKENVAAEESRIIFMNGAYNTHSSAFNASSFPSGSHHDYVIKITGNGMVNGTNTSKTVMITPENGYYAKVDGTKFDGSEYVLSKATTDVVFEMNPAFAIDSLTASKGDNKADGSASIVADNSTANEPAPKFYVCVYEVESGKLIDCAISSAETGTKTFSLDCQFEEGKRYNVKAMMWNANMKPLTSSYTIELR